MNPKYHGDAKDLFKRGFLHLLRSWQGICNLRTLPMLTGDFQKRDIAAYLNLLDVDPQSVVTTMRLFPRQQRAQYFGLAIAENHLGSDLFIDPDRGLVSDLRGDTSDREVLTFDEAS